MRSRGGRRRSTDHRSALPVPSHPCGGVGYLGPGPRVAAHRPQQRAGLAEQGPQLAVVDLLEPEPLG